MCSQACVEGNTERSSPSHSLIRGFRPVHITRLELAIRVSTFLLGFRVYAIACFVAVDCFLPNISNGFRRRGVR